MRIDTLPKNQLKSNVPDLRTGQVVRVHERIKEGDKERTQIFEGLVIATKHGKGLDGTFTVRKIGAGGIGVERIFPIHMPAIEKIEVLRQEKVRRSKLYYVRDQVGQKVKKRKTKLQSFIFDMGGTVEEEETASEEAEEAESKEGAPEESKTEEKTPEENTAEEKKEETPKEEEPEAPAEEKSEEPEKKEEVTEESGKEAETEEDKNTEDKEEAKEEPKKSEEASDAKEKENKKE